MNTNYTEETIHSDIDSFRKHANQAKHSISDMKNRIYCEPDTIEHWLNYLHTCSNLTLQVSQLSSTASWLHSESASDFTSECLSVSNELSNRFKQLIEVIQRKVSEMDESKYERILHSSRVEAFTLLLSEWRDSSKVTEDERQLIGDFQVDGLKGWGTFYRTYVNRLKVLFNGEERSVGEMLTFRSHSSPQLRKASHFALEETWEEESDILNRALNHSVGFAIEKNKRIGYRDRLEESLHNNRIQKKTLQAMWKAVDAFQPIFQEYLHAKAKCLGKKELPTYDFWAPLFHDNSYRNFQDAASFMLTQFGKVDRSLRQFSEMAMNEGWVDAEVRPNKSFVASCTSFPLTEESRIRMSYSGSFSDLLTLAHELGHAFHNEQLRGIEGLNRQYPLAIAETSSIYAELSVIEGALKETTNPRDRLYLLDGKLRISVMNFMNMRARFLFEQAFEEERMKGYVSVDQTNTLMQQAWDKVYNGSLSGSSSRYWAMVPHFYMTDTPYYNYPYTFGYLLSHSIKAKRKQGGAEVEEAYRLLLRNSGTMTVEELFSTYMGEDLTTPEIWERGLKECAMDVQTFVNSVEELKER